MRRAVPVIAATAGALALLANFHTRPAVGHLALSTPPSTLSATTTSAPAATTSSAPPAPGSGATTPPATTAAPTTTAATRTISGPVVATDYGDVQVRVTIRGGTLVDVQAIKLPFDRSRSQSISAQAGPMLRSEALRAQSAHIDVISGASYTSVGYIQSLQGAIDRARA